MAGPARRSEIVIPHAPKRHQRLAGWLVYAFLKCVGMTLRYRWIDRSGHFDGPLPDATVYCIWHNRLALSMEIYYRYIKRRNPASRLAALVSASRDGGFLAGVLESFRVQPVRGSSSRRGAQALRELSTWAKRGYDLAITPDGPRGPCYQAQPGIIALAQVTGMPIVPVSCHVSWKIQLKSWDRFQIPLPFSRCEVIFEKPIAVPRETSESQREALRLRLENGLTEMGGD